MEQTTCPQCGSELKRVPAGVSKRTGKPYNAFMACSNRECDYTARVTDKPENTGNQIAMEELANLTKGQKEIWKLLITIQNRVEDIYNNLDRK